MYLIGILSTYASIAPFGIETKFLRLHAISYQIASIAPFGIETCRSSYVRDCGRKLQSHLLVLKRCKIRCTLRRKSLSIAPTSIKKHLPIAAVVVLSLIVRLPTFISRGAPTDQSTILEIFL